MNEFGIRHFAKTNPDAVALIDPEGGAWSRADLLDFVDRTAQVFSTAGLRSGDVVALVSPNCAEYKAGPNRFEFLLQTRRGVTGSHVITVEVLDGAVVINEETEPIVMT